MNAKYFQRAGIGTAQIDSGRRLGNAGYGARAIIEPHLEQLDAADQGIEAEWTAEARSRLAAYRQGKMKAISLEQVLAKYRTK